jgi:hypothetical protein
LTKTSGYFKYEMLHFAKPPFSMTPYIELID